MINKIFYGRSLYKSKSIKGFMRFIDEQKLLPQDSKFDLINPNGSLTLVEDTAFCFRSTDQLLHKILLDENPIKNSKGYLAFNQHLPWFYTNYLPAENAKYNFIFYFDETNTDIVYKKGNQFIQVGGALDYGFYFAYHKLNLYLELQNELEFLKEIQNEDFGQSSKMRQISLLSKVQSIDDLGTLDEQIVLGDERKNLYFSIEPFMQEQRSKLFREQKTKTFKQQLKEDVTFSMKEEVAHSFEKVIYKQIYYNALSIRDQFHKKHPNEECVFLLCGKMTYNKYFRIMVKEICDKLGVKLILHDQKYHNIVPYFISAQYNAQDLIQNPQDLSTFMNVSYGVHKPLLSVI